MLTVALRYRTLILALLCCAFAARLAASDPKGPDSTPNATLPRIWVVPADWSSKVPPKGTVNAPEFFSTLYPGQRIALALLTQSPDRDELLAKATVDLRLAIKGHPDASVMHLGPTAVRQIKADGADFVLHTLEAADIATGDRAQLKRHLAPTTLALFVPNWTVPAVEAPAEVEITIAVSGAPIPVTIEPLRLTIRPTADWLHGPQPPADEYLQGWNRFRGDRSPGQLLVQLGSVANHPSFKAPPVRAFFGYAYRSDPTARSEAITTYSKLTQRTQAALLTALTLAGEDLGACFPMIPREALKPFAALQPLPDPRKVLHVGKTIDPQTLSTLVDTMDPCWAAWMATGDPTYLRTLVDLLEGASDYPAFTKWRDSKGGVKGLNARVARGMLYQIAGWSLGSFYRTDRHVTDWLLFWRDDPSVPATIRRELGTLLSNPAFQVK